MPSCEFLPLIKLKSCVICCDASKSMAMKIGAEWMGNREASRVCEDRLVHEVVIEGPLFKLLGVRTRVVEV